MEQTYVTQYGSFPLHNNRPWKQHRYSICIGSVNHIYIYIYIYATLGFHFSRLFSMLTVPSENCRMYTGINGDRNRNQQCQSIASKAKCSSNCTKWSNTFSTLAYLFQDSLIEKLLQFLIAVVNAELLKAVHLKIFCNIAANNNPFNSPLSGWASGTRKNIYSLTPHLVVITMYNTFN